MSTLRARIRRPSPPTTPPTPRSAFRKPSPAGHRRSASPSGCLHASLSGIVAADHRAGTTTAPIAREVFGGIPGPLQVAFYTVIPVMLVLGRVRASPTGCGTGSAAARDRRRTTPKNVKRRLGDFRAGVYMRTLLRDPAAGLMHSMIYFGFLVLLGVTTVLEIDHQLPEDLKFLHGRTYQALLVLRRPRRPGVRRSASSGRSSAATCSGRTASASRPSPSTPLILGMFLVIGVTGLPRRGVPHRRDRPADDSRSGASSATRSATLFDGLSSDTLEHVAPDQVDRPRRRVLRVPRDPADHDAAAHVHLAAEHVPARTASVRRAR